jgi:hypothetical protein
MRFKIVNNFTIFFIKCKKNYLTTIISAPKGIIASLAILKHCRPKGIPMIVAQQRIPKTQYIIASSMPPKTNQRIFNNTLPMESEKTISFPKGKKLKPANLKHWNPTGNPIIVTHQRSPMINQVRPPIKPGTINHNKLPINFIFLIYIKKWFYEREFIL